METAMKVHKSGVNQGSLMAADEWTWLIQDLPDTFGEGARREFLNAGEPTSTRAKVEANRSPKGTDVAHLPFFSYVDDTVAVLEVPIFGGNEVGKYTMEAFDKYAEENHLNWAPKKTKLSVFGHKEAPDDKFWVMLAGKQTFNKGEVEILGEILENNLFKGKSNYERTLGRARSAGRRVKWMCASEDGALLNLMRTMIIATVISRIRAGLALTSLTHRQYQTLDAVVGGVIKETMALGYHVSARAALALMGLRSMKSEMELEKLRIFGRANTTAAGPLTRQIMERRRDQIDEGKEKKGFLYDVAQILKRERLQKHWRNSKTWTEKTLNRWKTKIKTTMDKSDAVSWKRWLATKDKTRTEKHGSLNNNLQWTMPKLKGKDAWKRMNGGSQIRNALFITWMTGATNLRSNKTRTESDTAGRGNRECRLCGGGREDEWHLLDECEKLDAPRHLLWKRVDKLMAAGMTPGERRWDRAKRQYKGERRK
jgi:hypothetical protein